VGRVESIGGAVDPETRRAPVYVQVEEAAGLRAGMYARSLIEIEDAGLGIPSSAVLIKDGGRTEVFVRRDERTFVAREVTVGVSVEGRVPVLAGLAAGDAIVTRGALLLDGQAELLR
jgi:cobalt-zinc-cadmium efflux system membrane fusion protein